MSSRTWLVASGKRSAQATVLGVTSGENADRAALTLFRLAVDEVRPLLKPSLAQVADLALLVGDDATD